jgi:hypothetical protein
VYGSVTCGYVFSVLGGWAQVKRGTGFGMELVNGDEGGGEQGLNEGL